MQSLLTTTAPALTSPDLDSIVISFPNLDSIVVTPPNLDSIILNDPNLESIVVNDPSLDSVVVTPSNLDSIEEDEPVVIGSVEWGGVDWSDSVVVTPPDLDSIVLNDPNLDSVDEDEPVVSGSVESGQIIVDNNKTPSVQIIGPRPVYHQITNVKGPVIGDDASEREQLKYFLRLATEKLKAYIHG